MSKRQALIVKMDEAQNWHEYMEAEDELIEIDMEEARANEWNYGS